MIELGRSEEIILEMDRLASENHSHIATRNWRLPWQLVDSLERGEFRYDANKASTWLQESIVDIVPLRESGGQEALWKVVTKVPPHGGNGKRTGGNPVMRIHHKDEVTTDWTGKPVYSVGNYSFAVRISARIECKIYREYIGNSWQQSTVTDGECKYNTSWYRNSRTTNYDKWLRKSVYNDKHTTSIGETIVDNNVNDATHVDMRNMQNWAHLHAVS